VNTAPFRRELRRALDHYEGWGDRTAEYAVYETVRSAKEFAAQGDWQAARQIYSAILEEASDSDFYPFDDEGDFLIALQQVVAGIIECLDQAEIAESDEERQAALNSLLSAYIWDMDIGGIGLSDEIPAALLAKMKPADIPYIRQEIEAAQTRKLQSPYGEWGAEAYGGFLMELDVLDSTDPEIVLARLRDQRMHRLLFQKLLELGRVEEAIKVVEEQLTNPHHRLQAVEQLAEAGQAGTGIRLANVTLQQAFDKRLAAWLLTQYQAQGDFAAHLQLQEHRMKVSPSEHHYAELKQAAEQQGKWGTLHPEIIEWLKAHQHWATLTRVYLHDEEWDAAWEALKRVPAAKSSMVWEHDRLVWETAQRSRSARPRLAIPVYVQQARANITRRQRQHYAQAAQLLKEVRELYQQLQDEQGWRDFIKGIRAEFKNLPALQDELNKAGL
jgi:hypothetical protein